MRHLRNTLLLISLSCFAFGQNPLKNGAKPDNSENAKSSATVSVNPYSLDFHDQVVKTSSKPARITVTNTGGKDLYIRSASVADDEWQDFGIAVDTCTGATIPSGKSCVIDVRFTPSATGTRKAILSLTDDAMDSPQKLKLAGNGINSVDVPPRSPSTNQPASATMNGCAPVQETVCDKPHSSLN